MGRGARDSGGRVAASTGAMTEAPPYFDQPLSAVAGGGVLAALLKEGLPEHADRFLWLPKGYYGLTSVLLMLAFLFMGRNPEALRHEAPGERGAVVGLDRCPEARTLRRKIRALASDPQRVRDWQDALARGWIADAPDLAKGEAAALTLVFDRWSPALFARLARRGMAVIAWHKGFGGDPWPEGEFRTAAPRSRFRIAEVRLAEKRITLSGGPEVRQIRRLPDSGRQVPLVTTDMHTPMERVAGALFWRWSRENFFKYMREGLGLDARARPCRAGPRSARPGLAPLRPPHPAAAPEARHAAQPRRRPAQGLSKYQTYIGDWFRACCGHAGRSPPFRFTDT